ncbi:hypothetical protein [Luteolibacter luteus]|uniref:Uncharacterized protein n=1 Tax=Luteolibacter luteus TaxID=2728835 RepID=A0A858RD34_9BACT|nr:hypothetical protein [Luteolibacter luteus]QJE94230.1 hypothetical protein HHL09_21545 [Luteolibacter luteus]
MKALPFSIFAVSLAAGIASAEPPKKPPLTTYTKLWSDSPFTTKPPPAAAKEEDSAMADWTLGGVSEVEGGYMVTLLHKKNAGESMILRPKNIQKITADEIEWLKPGDPGTFKLDRVEYGKGGWKDITVHLVAGARSGVVRFDEKNLTPKASGPAPGNRQGQPGQPGQPVPGQPAQQPGAQPTNQQPAAPNVRQVRQRVVPPAPATQR